MYLLIEMISPALLWSSSGSSPSDLLHCALTSLVLFLPYHPPIHHLPSFNFHALCLILAISITTYCLNVRLTSSFTTLSSFITLSIPLQYCISVACNLLSCHFCTVLVLYLCGSGGTTNTTLNPELFSFFTQNSGVKLSILLQGDCSLCENDKIVIRQTKPLLCQYILKYLSSVAKHQLFLTRGWIPSHLEESSPEQTSPHQ